MTLFHERTTVRDSAIMVLKHCTPLLEELFSRELVRRQQVDGQASGIEE